MSAFRDALATRYGQALGAPVSSPAWQAAMAHPVIESMLGHRSVRAYRPDPVSDAQMAAILAAAQSAATSSNLQTWSVVAVRDPARKSRLAEYANNQAHIRECPVLLVWLADLSRLDRVGERVGVPAQANDYLEMFLVAVVDAALAAQNAAVAAEALGLGTVYIGAMRNRPEDVARELGLPPHVFAVFGLCLGHPDPARPASVKPRLDPGVILHQERYGVPADAEAAEVSRYDQVMRAFQVSQQMPAVDWSSQSATRVKGPESLSGRDRLKQAIQALGFRLD